MLEDITTFLEVTAMSIVPYALCSLGIMLGARTGVLNISGEGAMLTGASVGFLGAYLTGNPLIGMLLALAAGGGLGLIFAWLSVGLKLNQFMMGICIYIFGMGLADFIYRLCFGVRVLPPLIGTLSKVAIPGLSQIPIVGTLFNQNVLVYFTYVLTLVLFLILYKTRIGLETRAVGENPRAADVLGVKVIRRRYVCVAIGAAMMGLAGAYLPMVFTGTYTPLMSAGKGFMAIGVAILGSFRPERILAGSFLFAGAEVMSYRLQLGTGIPWQFLLMLPFIVVLIVMWIFYKRAEWPAAIGIPYSRE